VRLYNFQAIQTASLLVPLANVSFQRRRHEMSILYCPVGALLLQNIAEAMRRQCELPAKSRSIEEIAHEMDTAEAVQAANRHAADHLMACPICRTASPDPRMLSLPNRLRTKESTTQDHSRLK
jgi:hypothetical protein